uniref:Putative tick salivary metalloprotease n=1 Tax=Rhipicephalus pulchellus TaxID=72859 RepID=L7LRR3_RHIPC
MTMLQIAHYWLFFLFPLAHSKEVKQIVYPRMLESRAEDGVKILKITNDITLNLRKASVFPDEFFIHSTKDGLPIKYHMLAADVEKNLYEDAEQMASVDLLEEDDLHIEGVLGHTLRIKPLKGMQRSADGQTPHMVYEVENPLHKSLPLNDYGIPNVSDSSGLVESRFLWPTAPRLPVMIHPEVHVVTDYAFCEALKFDKNKIAKYLAIMTNSANFRYRSMVQPRVQLRLVGITVTNHVSEEGYIVHEEQYRSTNVILYGPTIEKFKTHVQQKHYFGNADIVFLITGRNMSHWEGNVLKHWVGGFAYLGGACTTWRVGMSEERVGSYYGVYVYGHELAHSLGCAHDGDAASNWPYGHIGSEDCPWRQGYMMSYEFVNPYMYRFSSCCQREVMNLYNREQYRCLRYEQNVHTVIRSSKLPGYVSSRDTYCKKVYNEYTYVKADKTYRDRICIVKCIINRQGDNMLIGAVDGVKCGPKQVCIVGNCTSKREFSLAE